MWSERRHENLNAAEGVWSLHSTWLSDLLYPLPALLSEYVMTPCKENNLPCVCVIEDTDVCC